MSERNLAAFTVPPGGYRHYPPYVSINERGGEVEITVRSPELEAGECGASAAIKLHPAIFRTMMLAALLALENEVAA